MLQTGEKEGKSVQYKLVGVRWYGRDCIGQKQAKVPENYVSGTFLTFNFFDKNYIVNGSSRTPNPTNL